MPIISETMHQVSERLESGAAYSDIILLHESARRKIYIATQGEKRFLLKAAASDSGRDLDMLKREYELSQGLAHPSIACAVAYEPESPVGPCIVMKYVDGRTLDEYIAEKHSSAERRRVFLQLLDAVDYIHKSGIVHNDLSPSNILVAKFDDSVKLIDFGFADDDTHYLDKAMGGTRGYSSPELMAGGVTDARSDIWSLGALIKDLFGSRYAALAQRCMNECPDKRPASVNEVRKAFSWHRAGIWLLVGLSVIAVAFLLYFVLTPGKVAPAGRGIPEPGSEPEPEAVDLGLSVLWASCNLGASDPEGSGDYYSWGDVNPAEPSDSGLESYKWCDGFSHKLTKYNTLKDFGVVDDKVELEEDDDAAAVKLGGGWRMPTAAEIAELVDAINCNWTLKERNGVKGYLVTSRKEGYRDKSIFLPLTRGRDDGSLKGPAVYLSSSSLLSNNPQYSVGAKRLYFIGFQRCSPCPIRPVKSRTDALALHSSAISEARLRLVGEDGRSLKNDAVSIVPEHHGAGSMPSKFVNSGARFRGFKKDAPAYVAVAPYYDSFVTAYYGHKDIRLTPSVDSTGVLSIYLKPMRSLSSGECDPSADFLVGRAKGSKFRMKRLQGMVRFSITASDIERMELVAIGGKPLSGMADVTVEGGMPRIVSWDDNNSIPYLKLRPSSGKCFQPGEYLVSVPPADYEQGFRLLLVRGDEEAEVLLHPVEVKRNATIDCGVVDAVPLKWRKFVDLSFLDYPRQGDLFGEYRKNHVGNWPFANVPENYFSDSTERLEKAHPNERVELKLPDGYSIVAFGEMGIFVPNFIHGFRLRGWSYLEFPAKNGHPVTEIAVTVCPGISRMSLKSAGATVPKFSSVAMKPLRETVFKLDSDTAMPVSLTGKSFMLARVKIYFGE